MNNAWVLTVSAAMARLAGLAVLLPGLSHVAIPWRLRWLMIAALALGLAGRQGAAALPADAPGLLAVLAGELALGLLVGLLANLMLVGAGLAAQQISQQVGLSLIAGYDESSQGSSEAITQLVTLTAVVVFFASGAHRVVLAGLADLPLGRAGGAGASAWLTSLTAVLAQAFVLALRVAAPVLGVMLATTLALGALQRSLPQMHVFSIGLAVRSTVGLAALSAGLVGLVKLVDVMAGFLQARMATLGAA